MEVIKSIDNLVGNSNELWKNRSNGKEKSKTRTLGNRRVAAPGCGKIVRNGTGIDLENVPSFAEPNGPIEATNDLVFLILPDRCLKHLG